MVKYQIGNVVYMDFKKTGSLTKGDLYNLENRITEIEQAQELCDPDRDGDVLDNLEMELESIIAILETSHSIAKKREKASK